MTKTKKLCLSGIIIFTIFGCKLLTNNDNNKPVETILIGNVVYEDIDDVQHGAVGARVGAYQNDQEKIHTIVSCNDGQFQLAGIQPGNYDIVFTSDLFYHPIKIADFNIVIGKNVLIDTVQLVQPLSINLDSIIVIQFKQSAIEDEIEKLIAKSRCNVEYNIAQIKFYILKIPSYISEIRMVEWFLKKSIIFDANYSVQIPIYEPPD